MNQEPPIVTAAKRHGINSLRELIDKGLYAVTIPPKQTAEEIKELKHESANGNKAE